MAELDPAAQAGGDPAAEAGPGHELDPRTLWAMLQMARTERDEMQAAATEMKELVQRVQAEFVNYKRRSEAERSVRAESVRGETINVFLPIVDDLERALTHLPASVAAEGWAQGLALIGRNLQALLERLGVTRVGVVGEPFDPNIHDAVAYEEHPEQPEDHVAAVARSGYRLGDRVIRPAQVVVARAPAEKTIRSSGPWQGRGTRGGARNGEAEASDVQQPRNIDRARES